MVFPSRYELPRVMLTIFFHIATDIDTVTSLSYMISHMI